MVKLSEIYFADGPLSEVQGGDLAVYLQMKKGGEGATPFRTLHVDLSQESEAIFQQISKGTRYEIRRAEGKDSLEVSVLSEPHPGEVEAFASFYDAFAATKGLSRCNGVKLESLRRAGGLVLSSVGREEPLCYHAYVTDGERARLLYSASLFRACDDSGGRALIGRANRLLHWRDMLHFKEGGYRLYDFGGLAGDARNAEQVRIEEFKTGFGGVVTHEYNLTVPLTLKGRVALSLKGGR